VVPRGQQDRVFRHVPIDRKPVWIQLAIPCVGCRDCGRVRQVKVALCAWRRRLANRNTPQFVPVSMPTTSG